MNDSSHQQKKASILRSLAIVGFVGVIVLIAWLSVRLVNSLPGAFSSLASLAETLTTTQQKVTGPESLILVSNTTLVNSGEPVTVTWADPLVPGSFAFSYTCSEGIAVDLQNVSGIESIACDTSYNVGEVTSLTFLVDSEKERYADLRYNISFFGANDTTARASGEAQLTIVNGSISSIPAINATSSEATTTETKPVETTTEPSAPQTPTQPVETPTTQPTVPEQKPVITTPSSEPEVSYVIPVSDPSGRVDLGVRALKVGTVSGKTFTEGTISQNSSGAVQFEIWNYGSKTSSKWTFTVTLPDGSTFRSVEQAVLKPNERATLIVGFPVGNSNSHTFTVTARETSDQVTLNDSMHQKVFFTK